jgi:hypothetical protein
VLPQGIYCPCSRQLPAPNLAASDAPDRRRDNVTARRVSFGRDLASPEKRVALPNCTNKAAAE